MNRYLYRGVKMNMKKLLLLLLIVVAFLASASAVSAGFLDGLMGGAQPEIIVPKEFTLESEDSGISTYSEPEGMDKIDIQKSSIPSKDYNNENVGILKTMVNNTEYTITIHGPDFHDSYMRDMSSIAQKRLMYSHFDEMISKGHLDSSLEDIQFYGDFEGIEVQY